VGSNGIVKTDYAANAGDSYQTASAGTHGQSMWQPSSYAETSETGRIPPQFGAYEDRCNDSTSPYFQSGVSFYRSELTLQRLEDGASNTYMVGEKWLCTDAYEGSASTPGGPDTSWGENQSMYSGYEWNNHRGAWHPDRGSGPGDIEKFQPAQDQGGIAAPFPEVKFGSAHPSAFNMVVCDGSVHSIAYEIDYLIHARIANRLDGQSASLP
jgi:hypothetical protein